MLTINQLNISLVENKKQVLENINLKFSLGKIYYIEGANGSGKSSLVSSIIGNPNYQIDSGEINLSVNNIDQYILDKLEIKTKSISLNSLESNERNQLGLFLAEQHPVEIPGVSLMQFLRLIYNSRLPIEKHLPVFKFKKLVKEKAELINYPEKLLKRNLNEGFSGGEKKKTEILQMLILEPNYVFLDEVDSGLDKQSREDVFNGLKNYFELRNKSGKKISYIIISHYDSMKDYLPADSAIRLDSGKQIE